MEIFSVKHNKHALIKQILRPNEQTENQTIHLTDSVIIIIIYAKLLFTEGNLNKEKLQAKWKCITPLVCIVLTYKLQSRKNKHKYISIIFLH